MNRMHVNFNRLSKILNLIMKQPIEGGVTIHGNMLVPKRHLKEINQIKRDLNKSGGKCRTRTKNGETIKQYYDLLRRTGDLLNERVSLDIQRITIGYVNGKRIQSLAYKYKHM